MYSLQLDSSLSQENEIFWYLNERFHKSLRTSEGDMRNLLKTTNENQFLHAEISGKPSKNEDSYLHHCSKVVYSHWHFGPR